MKNYPLYCPKCKQKSLIDAKDLRVTVLKDSKQKRRANDQSEKSEVIKEKMMK